MTEKNEDHQLREIYLKSQDLVLERWNHTGNSIKTTAIQFKRSSMLFSWNTMTWRFTFLSIQFLNSSIVHSHIGRHRFRRQSFFFLSLPRYTINKRFVQNPLCSVSWHFNPYTAWGKEGAEAGFDITTIFSVTQVWFWWEQTVPVRYHPLPEVKLFYRKTHDLTMTSMTFSEYCTRAGMLLGKLTDCGSAHLLFYAHGHLQKLPLHLFHLWNRHWVCLG